MACIDCHSENVIAPARACVECLEKNKLELIEAYKKSMEILNGLLLHCETDKEYRENRDNYHRCRLELLYTTNEIPRPKKPKARFRNGLYNG